MIEVPLRSGRYHEHSGVVAKVDDQDAELVLGRTWRVFISPWGRVYAVTGSSTLLHRWLLNAPTGWNVEHRNQDGLDCRRENLVLLTHSQHLARQSSRLTRRARATTSKFKGVSAVAGARPWRATVSVEGRQRYLGRFQDEVEAAKAYDVAARLYFGEFATTNFPQAEGV